MGWDLIIYVLVFVGVLILIEGLYLVVFGKEVRLNSKINRRLQMMELGTRSETYAKLRKERDIHEHAKSIPIYSLYATKAEKAALAFTPTQMIGIMIGLFVGLFFILGIVTSTSAGVRMFIAFGAATGAPYFWLSGRAKKRMDLIQEQLPDAIDLMVRSLRVSHPFSAALAIAAKEVKDPLATELGMISDEISYGRDMGETLGDLAERLDMQDLRFLAVAVSIQQQSGGNLAEVLSGLVSVIRERFRLFRKVAAITSESKFSGNFLSAFPILAIIVINVLDPNYYDASMETPYFMPACFVVGGMILANLLVMRKLTNIKV
jgi:tight adherence protein B